MIVKSDVGFLFDIQSLGKKNGLHLDMIDLEKDYDFRL